MIYAAQRFFLWALTLLMVSLAIIGLSNPALAAEPPPLVPPAHSPAIAPINPEQGSYLAELVARARDLRLWEQRQWQLLLHYVPNTFLAGVTSEADGKGFFLAPDGKTNPQAELEATLARFFSEEVLQPGKMTPQCTFPARYHWLDGSLGFDPARMAKQDCPRFQAWRNSLAPQSVSLVFASAYINNPASMFGHTLLVLNKQGRAESEWLLNYAVNYAAIVPPDAGAISYVTNGMFGGFIGFFSILPYYMKVREYNDMESRDLWEYRLSLSGKQLERLIRHTWEMGSTYFDYFFLKENCSYHLLSLLEVADPRLHLRDGYTLWTGPPETIRSLYWYPGLVEEVIYRPSRGSQMAQKMDAMTPGERKLLGGLIAQGEDTGEAGFPALPPEREALILEAAVDYFQEALINNQAKKIPLRAKIRKLLLRRAQLGAGAPQIKNSPQSTPPHSGHETSYFQFGVGADETQGFIQVGIQPSFHNLLSREDGYAKNSQLDFLRLRLRYGEVEQKTRLEDFTVLDMFSAPPVSFARTPMSWRVRGGWQRDRSLTCADCYPFFLDGGVGLTLESRLLRRELYFAFAEAVLGVHREFAEGHRAGLGTRLGMMGDVTESWRFLLTGVFTEYRSGDLAQENRVEFRNRFVLGRNVDFNLEFLRRNDHREGRLSLGFYF